MSHWKLVTDRQTDSRQTDRRTVDRQTVDRQTERQTEREKRCPHKALFFILNKGPHVYLQRGDWQS